MEWFAATYLNNLAQRVLSVLDVGSFDVNGSYRPIFPPPRFTYHGLDMSSGPNVDIVARNPYCWQMLDNEAFDVVITGQAFEHIEFFWFTLAEVARVLKPGGYFCLIVPRFQPRHRYPVDVYRFDVDGLVALARYCNFTVWHASMNQAPPGASRLWYGENGDAFLVAQKPLDWDGVVNAQSYVFTPADLDKLATGFIEMVDQPFFKFLKKFLLKLEAFESRKSESGLSWSGIQWRLEKIYFSFLKRFDKELKQAKRTGDYDLARKQLRLKFEAEGTDSVGKL